MAIQNKTLTDLADSIQLTKQSGTKVTLTTNESYVNGNIVLNLSARTATPAITGGAPSGTATFGTPTNCVLSETNSSGISVITSGTCSRAAIKYNGAIDGWVTANNGATPSGGGASSAVDLTTTIRYLTKVTLTNGKTFQIEVPNGSSDPITFTFSVDANGNTTIT